MLAFSFVATAKRIVFEKNKYFYYIIGACWGDGSFCRVNRSWVLKLYSSDEDFLRFWKESVGKCSSLKVIERLHRDEIGGKKIYDFAVWGVELAKLKLYFDDPKWVSCLKDEEFFYFMRGFFDAEGSCHYRVRKDSRYSSGEHKDVCVQIANTDSFLLRLMRREMLRRGFEKVSFSRYKASSDSFGKKDKCYLRMHSFVEAKKFFDLIGTSIARKRPVVFSEIRV